MKDRTYEWLFLAVYALGLVVVVLDFLVWRPL